jgi:hypothetical protein
MDKTLAETGDVAIRRRGKVICEEEIWREREREKERVKQEEGMENNQAELPTSQDRLKCNPVWSALGQVR